MGVGRVVESFYRFIVNPLSFHWAATLSLELSNLGGLPADRSRHFYSCCSRGVERIIKRLRALSLVGIRQQQSVTYTA